MEGCPTQKFIIKANDQMQQHLQVSVVMLLVVYEMKCKELMDN